MPKLHTFTDAFPASSLDAAKWTSAGSSSTSIIVDGKARLSLNSTTGFRERWINSVATDWDLTASHGTVKVDGVIGSADGMNLFQLRLPGDNNNRVGIFAHTNGTLYADDFQAGVQSQENLGTYSPTDDLYWRIQEVGGTVLWRTSPDGVNWTTRRSKAVSGFALTALQVQLYAYGNPPAANPTRFIIDDVNISPQQSFAPGLRIMDAGWSWRRIATV